MTKTPQPCQVCSGNSAAAMQALQNNQRRIFETSCPHPFPSFGSYVQTSQYIEVRAPMGTVC